MLGAWLALTLKKKKKSYKWHFRRQLGKLEYRLGIRNIFYMFLGSYVSKWYCDHVEKYPYFWSHMLKYLGEGVMISVILLYKYKCIYTAY